MWALVNNIILMSDVREQQIMTAKVTCKKYIFLFGSACVQKYTLKLNATHACLLNALFVLSGALSGPDDGLLLA